jgi:hypothetical protein
MDHNLQLISCKNEVITDQISIKKLTRKVTIKMSSFPLHKTIDHQISCRLKRN